MALRQPYSSWAYPLPALEMLSHLSSIRWPYKENVLPISCPRTILKDYSTLSSPIFLQVFPNIFPRNKPFISMSIQPQRTKLAIFKDVNLGHFYKWCRLIWKTAIALSEMESSHVAKSTRSGAMLLEFIILDLVFACHVIEILGLSVLICEMGMTLVTH